MQRGGKGASDLMVPWMQEDWVPWVGVFQAPETFAKENAKMSTSASNPVGTAQYPAIIYVPVEEHRRLVIRPLKYDIDDADAMPMPCSCSAAWASKTHTGGRIT